MKKTIIILVIVLILPSWAMIVTAYGPEEGLYVKQRDPIDVMDYEAETAAPDYTYQLEEIAEGQKELLKAKQEMLAVQIAQQEYLSATVAVQKMIVGMIAVLCGLIVALIITVIWNGTRHK